MLNNHTFLVNVLGVIALCIFFAFYSCPETVKVLNVLNGNQVESSQIDRLHIEEKCF
jgi:beta-lactam-binding protein with PASTA domain